MRCHYQRPLPGRCERFQRAPQDLGQESHPGAGGPGPLLVGRRKGIGQGCPGEAHSLLSGPEAGTRGTCAPPIPVGKAACWAETKSGKRAEARPRGPSGREAWKEAGQRQMRAEGPDLRGLATGSGGSGWGEEDGGREPACGELAVWLPDLRPQLFPHQCLSPGLGPLTSAPAACCLICLLQRKELECPKRRKSDVTQGWAVGVL